MSKCKFKVDVEGDFWIVTLINPFRTKNRKAGYSDHTRRLSKNRFTEEEIQEVAEQLAMGCYSKMVIAHNDMMEKRKKKAAAKKKTTEKTAKTPEITEEDVLVAFDADVENDG